MRIILLFSFVLLTASVALAKDVLVDGHYKRDGTYIKPYHRSSPNDTVVDNYSHKGNFNPYSGETGSSYDRTTKSSQYYNPYKSDGLSDSYRPFR